MLQCVECGRSTKNLTQVYCECGGFVEVIPKKKSGKRKNRKSRIGSGK